MQQQVESDLCKRNFFFFFLVNEKDSVSLDNKYKSINAFPKVKANEENEKKRASRLMSQAIFIMLTAQNKATEIIATLF